MDDVEETEFLETKMVRFSLTRSAAERSGAQRSAAERSGAQHILRALTIVRARKICSIHAQYQRRPLGESVISERLCLEEVHFYEKDSPDCSDFSSVF